MLPLYYTKNDTKKQIGFQRNPQIRETTLHNDKRPPAFTAEGHLERYCSAEPAREEQGNSRPTFVAAEQRQRRSIDYVSTALNDSNAVTEADKAMNRSMRSRAASSSSRPSVSSSVSAAVK